MDKSGVEKRKSVGMLKLGSLLPDVTKSSFKKRGFAESKIISEWEQIVGIEVAKHSIPFKLSFNRESRTGGVLHIRAFGSISTALQHLEPLIIDRIATYFGYQAVSKIKILHSSEQKTEAKQSAKTGTQKRTSPTLDNVQNAKLKDLLSEINDDNLKAALEKFGRSFLGS